MFLDWTAVRIFVRPGATDLRKQINGLAAMAQGEMSQDPFLCGGPRYVTGGAHPTPGRQRLPRRRPRSGCSQGQTCGLKTYNAARFSP